MQAFFHLILIYYTINKPNLNKKNDLQIKFTIKIKHNKAKIGVIGLGYVGLPLACSFAKKNFK